MDVSKAVLPRLYALIRAGAHGSAAESFPCLAPLLLLLASSSGTCRFALASVELLYTSIRAVTEVLSVELLYTIIVRHLPPPCRLQLTSAAPFDGACNELQASGRLRVLEAHNLVQSLIT